MKTAWLRVRTRARALGTDGCSRPATQYARLACWRHDIHYQTHRTFAGRPIGKLRADWLLWWDVWRVGVRRLGWHPRTWWNLVALPLGPVRFLAVSVGGWRAWWRSGSGTPQWAHRALFSHTGRPTMSGGEEAP